MVDHLSPRLFISSLGEDRTHRPTTNLQRQSLDDCNHSFEWSPGVLSLRTNPQLTTRSKVQTIMPSPNESQRVVPSRPKNQTRKTNQMKSIHDDDNTMKSEAEGDFAALIGLDWGSAEHALCLHDCRSGERESSTLAHTPEAIAHWGAALQERYPGKKSLSAWSKPRAPSSPPS
jgi:hypothetical protein